MGVYYDWRWKAVERHELNRMFDQLAPTPKQKQKGLGQLLQTEKRVIPLKNPKRE